MTEAQPDPARQVGSWQAALPLFLTIPLLLSLVAGVLQNSIEFAPDHSSAILSAAWWITALFGVFVFVLMLEIKPALRTGPFVGALMFGFMAGAGMGMLSYRIIDRIWQTIDFSGEGVHTIDGYFPIRRGYITHGKGGYDHVTLYLFNADLHASPRDYRKLFHDTEEVHPVGYCIRARLQQRDGAARLFIPAIGSFPTGSIARCPAKVTRLRGLN